MLARLAWIVGADVSPVAINRAARRTEGSEPWTERLVRGLDELGVRARAFDGTVHAAARATGPAHPVVGVCAQGYLILLERRGRRVLVELPDGTTATLSSGRLAEVVEPDDLKSVRWVAVDPPLGIGETSTEDAPGVRPTPGARLRRLMRRERHDLGVVAIYAAGVGLLTLATPVAVQALVSAVAFGTLLAPLIVLAILLGAGLTLSSVLRALSTWVTEVLQRRIVLRLVDDLAHRLPRVPLSRFDRTDGRELLNRFFDVFTVQKTGASLLLGALDIVLTAAAGMLVLAFYHPLLLAFDVLLVAAMGFVVFGLGRAATPTAVVESKKKYALAAWLQDIAEHPHAFKSAGGAELARRRAEALLTGYLEARATHFRVVFKQIGGALTLHVLASTALLAMGGWLVIERQLTLGQLVAAELIVTAVVSSFAKIGKHLESGYDLLAAIDKLGELADLPIEASGDDVLERSAGEGVALQLERVALEKDGVALLEETTIAFARGERIAIGGEGASGRSTLAELLAGLRPPTRGRLIVERADARDLARDALARTTSLVRGDEVIRGSIADNVVFGRDLDKRSVREALTAVDLLDRVAELPEGLSTQLVRGGSPLSRGQVARLTIARAIAGRPGLLVVDRALDILDRSSRRWLFDVLASPSAPWTLLLVTDDAELRARCDRTIAIRDGILVED